MIKITETATKNNRLTISELEPRTLYRRLVSGYRFEGYLIVSAGKYICFCPSDALDVYTCSLIFSDDRFELVDGPVTLENIF